MNDTRQQRIMRLFRQRLMIVLFIGAIFLLVPAVWSAWGKERDSHENRIEAESQLKEQLERKRDLEIEVEELKTEKGLEKALRHRFDVGYEGEGVIYIVDAQGTGTASEVDSSAGLWSKIQSIWPF